MPILFSCACKFKKQDEFSEATLLEACGYHATMQRKLADLALSAKRNEAQQGKGVSHRPKMSQQDEDNFFVTAQHVNLRKRIAAIVQAHDAFIAVGSRENAFALKYLIDQARGIGLTTEEQAAVTAAKDSQ